jgi:hypothetical protein
MKRKPKWFRISSGLVLSLLFLMVLPACKPLIEVTVHAQCASEAMRGDDTPPTGKCLYVNGVCQKTRWCTC